MLIVIKTIIFKIIYMKLNVCDKIKNANSNCWLHNFQKDLTKN